MNKGSLPLFGIYRVRNVPPGFGICLFRSPDSSAMAQAADKDGLVTTFLPVNIEGSIIFDAPCRLDGTEWSVSVGQGMLYAFHRTDGSFAIGSRKEVETAVREELPKLFDAPFVWEEAASFVGDEDHLRLAKAETERLLRRPV